MLLVTRYLLLVPCRYARSIVAGVSDTLIVCSGSLSFACQTQMVHWLLFTPKEEVGLLETKGRAGTFVGASGDVTLRRARDAAAAYAEQVRALGLSADEALAIVKAALET